MGYSQRQFRKRYVFAHSRTRPGAHSRCRCQHPAGFREHSGSRRDQTPYKIEGKLGTSRSGGHLCPNNWATARKASEDETRKRVQEALKASTAESANYAENTISKFQRAYLKKYYPWEHSTSAPQGASDKWFGYGIQVPALLRGLREPVKSEEDKEGIANIAHGF